VINFDLCEPKLGRYQAIPILMHASRIQGATQDCTRLTLGEHTRYGNDCTVMIV